MKSFLLVSYLAGLTALCSGAIDPADSKLLIKLSPLNNDAASDGKDLDTAASDRTFFINKEPGGYAGYGNYPGSIYGSGYRGTSMVPGYRGYPSGNPTGIIGGGNTGYGYYGGSGYNPYYNYGGYGNYGGLGGYGSYSGYGGISGYGTIGTGGYDDGYAGVGRGSYGRYGGQGFDGYGSYGTGYGTGYGGYGGSYGSSYGVRNNYDPYNYRASSYGSYSGYPSGYRGYS